MITLGIFLTALTFPGVMVREAAHLFFCRLFKLAIFDVRFLELNPPFGHVQHEHPNHFWAAAVETLGPFFLNSVLCILFCWAVFLPVWELRIFDPLARAAIYRRLEAPMGPHAAGRAARQRARVVAAAAGRDTAWIGIRAGVLAGRRVRRRARRGRAAGAGAAGRHVQRIIARSGTNPYRG